MDAADAAKPGDATTGAQPTSEAALEAGVAEHPRRGAHPDRGRRRPARACSAPRARATRPATAGWSPRSRCRGPSERPYGGWFDEVVDILTEVLDESGTTYAAAVESVVVDREELTLHVAREHLVEVAQVLRDDQDLRFELSLGVSGVHYPHDAGRELHAVYHLVSVTHSRRLRLEVAVPDADPHLPSTVVGVPGQRLARARDLRLLRDRSSTVTPPWPASRCPTTGRATRSARTTPSAASRSSTRAPPSRPRTSGGRTDDHPDTSRHATGRRRRHRGRALVRGVRRRLVRHRRGGRAPRRGADRRQHGPAAPVDARRAPAHARDRRRDGDRGPRGHRLPAHRHREEHGVPHLDPGRDVLHAHGLRGARCSRRPRTAWRSRSCWASRTTSPSGPRSSGC